jgi:hypothetical protein
MASKSLSNLDSQESTTEADLCPPLEDSREDAIRRGAYALYEARNGVAGSEEDDWLQAEALLLQIANHGV